MIRSGKPIFQGTRITVTDILEYLAGGVTEDEILADSPDLTVHDIVLRWPLQRNVIAGSSHNHEVATRCEPFVSVGVTSSGSLSRIYKRIQRTHGGG